MATRTRAPRQPTKSLRQASDGLSLPKSLCGLLRRLAEGDRATLPAPPPKRHKAATEARSTTTVKREASASPDQAAPIASPPEAAPREIPKMEPTVAASNPDLMLTRIWRSCETRVKLKNIIAYSNIGNHGAFALTWHTRCGLGCKLAGLIDFARNGSNARRHAILDESRLRMLAAMSGKGRSHRTMCLGTREPPLPQTPLRRPHQSCADRMQTTD